MSLYYVLMHFWTTLFGSSEIVFRLPSLVSACAIIITAGALAARIAGRLAGYFSAFFIAMHPFLLPVFSTEARSYAAVTALVAGAALVARSISSGQSPKPKSWFAWSGLATAAIGMHFLSSVAIAAQFFWLAPRLRHTLKIAMPALIVPSAVAAVMTLFTLEQSFLQSWIPQISLGGVRYVFVSGLGSRGGILIIASCLAAIALVLVGRQSITVPQSMRVMDILALTTWAFGPLLAFCLYSVVATPLLVNRYLLFSVVGFASLAGCFFAIAWVSVRDAEFNPMFLRTIVIFGIVVALVGGVGLNLRDGGARVAPKPESLRDASRWITSRELSNDGILYSPTWAEAGMRWYLSESVAQSSPINLTAETGASAADAASLWTPSSEREIALSSDFPSVSRVFIVGYTDQNWTPVKDVGSNIAGNIRRCWTLVDDADYGIKVELWVRSAESCQV